MLAYLLFPIRYLLWLLASLLRRLQRAPDYVTIMLEGEYPALPDPPAGFVQRRLRPPRVSLPELAECFRRIARDDRVRGVVLHLRPLSMQPGELDTLRDLILSLRTAGKRVVAWSYAYDSSMYYAATAADTILLLPGGRIAPLALLRRYTYLADTLEQAGLKVDVVQISPFKSAGDMFTRRSMSEEVRQMADWLIDAAYQEMQRGIAEGRGVDQDSARDMIDKTPCTDLEARELGFVDELLGEEDLGTFLQEGQRPARLLSWKRARSRLRDDPPVLSRRYVAVIGIEGEIVDGHSRRPPVQPPIRIPFVTSPQAGDLSVAAIARRIRADRRAAAAVLYVNSRGGSATASEAIHAALSKLATTKPLVVAMGGIAASGGYYVSTPGQVIFAQPNTITGSIGVLSGKLVNAGLLDRLLVGRETLTRGEHAVIYDTEQPFSEKEREIVWASIQRSYDIFAERVSTSRKMDREAVDGIGAGRVWSGRQALERGLVDEIGGLDQALAKARQMAGLDARAPARCFFPSGRPSAPLPETMSLLTYALQGIRTFNLAGPLYLCPLSWHE